MAREASIQKHRKLQAKWEQLNKELAEIETLPKEKREEAMAAWDAKRIKNRMFSSKRYNRCAITGRSRGFYGYFGVCRQVLREKAHKGELPGVKKSSW
jgi:small subunit ribosomal protein S14